MTDHVEQETDPLVAARRERHAHILESGGYPDRYDRTDWAADLKERFADLEPGTHTEVETSVAGRLMLHRSFGKLQFGTLRDGSGTIQLLVDRGHAGDEIADRFEAIDLGDWVGAKGSIMTTRKGELSVNVDGAGRPSEEPSLASREMARSSGHRAKEPAPLSRSDGERGVT